MKILIDEDLNIRLRHPVNPRPALTTLTSPTGSTGSNPYCRR